MIMAEDQTHTEQPSVASSAPADAQADAEILTQYGCGPIQFAGHGDTLYDRHLLFDDVIDPAAGGAREHFEAAARSVRDVLSQRWVHTERTYNRKNPKRIYYLSMEFLIGRSLGNNVINLLFDPLVQQAVQERGLDWLACWSKNPTPASVTAVWGA
jgi:starch phosphorylase